MILGYALAQPHAAVSLPLTCLQNDKAVTREVYLSALLCAAAHFALTCHASIMQLRSIYGRMIEFDCVCVVFVQYSSLPRWCAYVCMHWYGQPCRLLLRQFAVCFWGCCISCLAGTYMHGLPSMHVSLFDLCLVVSLTLMPYAMSWWRHGACLLMRLPASSQAIEAARFFSILL